jgi:hypothetical protein
VFPRPRHRAQSILESKVLVNRLALELNNTLNFVSDRDGYNAAASLRKQAALVEHYLRRGVAHGQRSCLEFPQP